jgi:hypothetical protein
MPRIEDTAGDLGRRLARETERVAREAGRVAQDGLQRTRKRAKQQDRLGNATYRALELAHTGLGSAARALSRLEEAVQPPTRGDGRRTTKAVAAGKKD